MNVQGIALVYLLFVFLPFVAAVGIFIVFARKKKHQDRAAGILPPRKKKKPSLVRRLWDNFIQKQASSGK